MAWFFHTLRAGILGLRFPKFLIMKLQVDGMRRKWNDPTYRAIMRRVTGDGVANPEAYRQARDKLISPHLAALDNVLRRGVEEGLIRPELDLGWIRQMMTAPIMAATLTFKERVTRGQIETSVDVVLRGAARVAQ